MTIEIPGYQTVAIERDCHGVTWLYLGRDFVAFTPEQWREFLDGASNVTAED